MDGKLLFLNGIVLFVDKIVAVDFREALPTSVNRRVTIKLSDDELVIEDTNAIDTLVTALIPEHLRPRFKSSIQIVKN